MTVTDRTARDGTTRESYFSVRQLKERGWTERLVRRYLEAPDRTIPNPRRKSGAPKRLYLKSRVIGIEESSDEFTRDKARSDGYSGRLQVQSDAKRLHLEKLVRGIALPALTLEWAEVRRLVRALRDSGHLNCERPESELALEVLLGTMKSLEWNLDEFMYHSGIREARKLLRRRMLAHIIERYPVLADAAKSRAAKEDGNTDGW